MRSSLAIWRGFASPASVSNSAIDLTRVKKWVFILAPNMGRVSPILTLLFFLSRFTSLNHEQLHKKIWYHTLIENLKAHLWVFSLVIWYSIFSLIIDVRFQSHLILLLQHLFFIYYQCKDFFFILIHFFRYLEISTNKINKGNLTN